MPPNAPVQIKRAVWLYSASLLASAILFVLSLKPEELADGTWIAVGVLYPFPAAVLFYASKGRNWARLFLLLFTALLVLFSCVPVERPAQPWWSSALVGAMVLSSVAAMFLLFIGRGAQWFSRGLQAAASPAATARINGADLPASRPAPKAPPPSEAEAAGWRERHIFAGMAVGTVLGFALGFGAEPDSSRSQLEGLFMVPFLAAIIGSKCMGSWRVAVVRARGRSDVEEGYALALVIAVALWFAPWVVAALVVAFSWKVSSLLVMFGWGILHLFGSVPTVYRDISVDPMFLSGVLLIIGSMFLG